MSYLPPWAATWATISAASGTARAATTATAVTAALASAACMVAPLALAVKVGLGARLVRLLVSALEGHGTSRGAFSRAFRHDPLIGRSVRMRPWLRPARRPEPFEALAWAICRQLIEAERAGAIERSLLAALGRRWIGAADGESSLRDLPPAGVLAGTAPARLESCGLAPARARTLVRAAREVACGRLDLLAEDHERGWRRLLAVPGIGAWTVEMLALHGQGRHDQLPAGDLTLLKLVGRLLSGGDPRARAEEQQVRDFFARYGEWAGLAATHMLAGAA